MIKYAVGNYDRIRAIWLSEGYQGLVEEAISHSHKDSRASSLLTGLLGGSGSLGRGGLGGSNLSGGGGLGGSSLLGSGDGGGGSLLLGDGSLGSVLLLVGSLLLLEVLGEELLVSDVSLLGGLPGVNLALLEESLSSDSLLGDESLDLRGLVEGLVALLDLSADNELGDIVDLSKSISLSDLTGSLGAKSSGLIRVGETSNFAGTLLEDLKGNDAKIGTADATSDGLSLALTISSRSVGLGSYTINIVSDQCFKIN